MSEYDEGTKIIYWAANSTDNSKIIEDPFEAYKNFNNIGVSVVKNGKAEVRLYCPDKYKVKKIIFLIYHIVVFFRATYSSKISLNHPSSLPSFV